MPNKISIGLDLSINSTGVCVNMNNTQYFYIITSKMTQKGIKLYNDMSNKICNVILYDKVDHKGLEYSQKELAKTTNYYTISNHIIDIIKTHSTTDDEIECYIEGVSYGSIGSAALVDLVGLNFVVRTKLIENNYKFTIVSPTENKRDAVGNGQATKDLMVYSFLQLHPQFGDFNKVTKIDDIADAYFLSVRGECL